MGALFVPSLFPRYFLSFLVSFFACLLASDSPATGANAMSMKHPERYHAKAAKNRRKKQQRLKEEKREARQKLAAAEQPAS
jgi:hypothetical protein